MQVVSEAFEARLPYPEIKAERKNPKYAGEMLSNIGGSASEISAVSLYVYNSLILWQDKEAAAAFHKISIVEMHHLEIFATLARMLGAEPRLWAPRGNRMQYWSPVYNKYFIEREKAIKNAVEEERRTIEKYTRQARRITDAFVVENIERIIMDEQVHVEILNGLLRGY